MTVVEVVEVKLEWRDLENLTDHDRPKNRPRSPGVHVSGILKHVARMRKAWTREDEDDEMPLRILLGLAFEESAARLYKDLWWQPGEFELSDGMGPTVYGSLDGLEDIGFPCFRVHEFKYTGKSLREKGGKEDQLKDIRTEWLWMQQGMSYVNMVRARGMKADSCVFHICWKYGVYGQWPLTERYFRYLVRFEERELEGNLMLLYNHRDEVKGE